MKKRESQQMERDILLIVRDFGQVHPGSVAAEKLSRMYPNTGDQSQINPANEITATFDYLVAECYLWPLFDSEGRELRNGLARAITPKGLKRLRQIEHPVRAWIGDNWFPFVVALATVALTTASIVTSVLTSGQP